MCALLDDIHILGIVGFQTSFGDLKKAVLAQEHERRLDDDDLLAQQAFDLTLGILKFRVGSMSWHVSWPGLLVRFGSEVRSGQEDALEVLRRDDDCFQHAQDLVGASPFLGKMCQRSPFKTRLMSEVCEWAFGAAENTEAEVLAELHALARKLFFGWGHTKIIEDGLKTLRDREERDVTNRKVSRARQWGVLRDDGTISSHKRVEINDDDHERASDVLPASCFSCRDVEPTIDALSMVRKATWPTMSAQTSQVLASERALFQKLEEDDQWDMAPYCWKCMFVPSGTVLVHEPSNAMCVSLGALQYVALAKWELDRVEAPNKQ